MLEQRKNICLLLVLSLLFPLITSFALGIRPSRIVQAHSQVKLISNDGISKEEFPYANVLLDMSPLKFPVKPYIEDGTTMVPLRVLGEAIGAEIGWDNTSKSATYSKNDLSFKITIGNKSITNSNGQIIAMPKPPTLLSGNTMVPIRFFTEILGYKVSWDERTRTVHILSPEQSLNLWGFYALGSTSYSSWQDAFGAKYPYSTDDCPARSMAGLFLGWFTIDQDGTVTSEHNPTGFQKPQGWPSVILEAKWSGAQIFSMFFSDEQSGISSLLDNRANRVKIIKDIVSISVEYDGVLIDFEGLGLDQSKSEKDKQNFNQFLAELKRQLNKKQLSVALPPIDSQFAGYDYKYIGEVADFVVLMAYNYHDPNSPSPVAPFDKVDNTIKQTIEIIEPQKLVLGIPAYGALYKIEDGQSLLSALPPAKDGLSGLPEYPINSKHDAIPVFVPDYLCNYLEWQGENAYYKAYLEDQRSFTIRSLLVKRYGLKGAAVWRLGLLPKNWQFGPC